MKKPISVLLASLMAFSLATGVCYAGENETTVSSSSVETISENTEELTEEGSTDPESEEEVLPEEDPNAEDPVIPSEEEQKEEEDQPEEEDIQIAEDEPSIVIEDVNQNETVFHIRFQNYTGTCKNLQAAIWSEENGQDDLAWYPMTKEKKGVYGTELTIADHGSVGKYFIHIYGKQNKKDVFLADTEMVISSATCGNITTETPDLQNGTVRVHIDQVYSVSGIKNVQVNVWTKSGQKDLVTYKLKKASVGNYYFDLDISKNNYHYGSYYMRFFLKDGNGITQQLKDGSVFFRAKQNAPVYSVSGEKYKIQVSDIVVPGGLESVRFRVWSPSLGLSSKQVIEAKYNEKKSSALAEGDLDDINLSGTLKVRAYGTTTAGQSILLGESKFVKEGCNAQEVSVSDYDRAGGKCTINISGVTTSYALDRIRVYCWSDKDGQDDMKSFRAKKIDEKNYRLSFETKKLKNDNGNYSFHVYAVDKDGKEEFIGNTSAVFTPIAPTVKIEKKDRKFVLSATDIHTTELKIGFAIWSEADQSDLTWHWLTYDQATDIASKEVYALTKAENAGEHQVHVYAKDADGVRFFLTSFTYDAPAPENKGIYVDTDNATGKFRISVENYPEVEGSTFRAAVWKKADQSDLVWYTAKKKGNGAYVIESSIAKHSYQTGTYNVHVYRQYKNGKQKILQELTMTFSVKKGKISYTEKNNGKTYEVKISPLTVPGTASRVSFAIWSDEGGQDDLQWYEAKGTNGGAYTASVDISKHKTEGKYTIVAYALTKGGKQIKLGTDQTLNVSGYAKGKVKVVSENTEKGKFTVNVNITDSTPGVAEVYVAAWTRSNQSDIVWYDTKYVNGVYKVEINVADHNCNTGVYQIHAYAELNNGIDRFVNDTTYTFKPQYMLAVSDSVSVIDRKMKFIDTANQYTKVEFAVWSKRNGKDDLVWYKATKKSDGGWMATVNAAKHKDGGDYNVWVYVNGNRNNPIAKTTFTTNSYLSWAVSAANNDSIGYSQANRYLNPDVDCSSLVYYSLYYTGFAASLPSSPFATDSEPYWLKNCGFKEYTYVRMSDLQPGDILWYRRDGGGHTEIYLGDGKAVGAHCSEDGGIYGKGGDQTGHEVCVGNFNNCGWMRYYRLP